jgi:hypothetical protein
VIVFSAGMQKAGSGWYFNLTNDLLVAAGRHDARAVRERFGLDRVLRHYNCNIDPPTFSRLARVSVPHFRGHTFAVKSHSRPTRALRAFFAAGIMRPTYIFRDPRDAALSAFEHGEKLRSQGRRDSFGSLDSLKSAFQATREWLDAWAEWSQCPEALLVRYEDLLADPLAQARRLMEFLGLDVPAESVSKVVAAYQAQGFGASLPQGLHFNRGVVGRFRDVFGPADLALGREYFGPFLQRMGYAE